jgi:hypothetical protein
VTMPRETLIEAVKAAPPAGALVAWVNGQDLQQWVLGATLIYTSVLVDEKLFKFGRWLYDRRCKNTG